MAGKTNLQILLSDNIFLDLILVEGGNFLMGDNKSELDAEKPAHEVSLRAFYIGNIRLPKRNGRRCQELIPQNTMEH